MYTEPIYRPEQKSTSSDKESPDIFAFSLPDVSVLKRGEKMRETEDHTQLIVGGAAFPCKLTFEQNEGGHPPSRTIKIKMDIFDPETKRLAASFVGAVIKEINEITDLKPDREYHVHCSIDTRKVEIPYRQLGLGSACIRAYEDICRELGEKDAAWKVEWISVYTRLESLTRLLISQKWLEKHGLSRYEKRSGMDFGYIPAPKSKWDETENEAEVRDVLESGGKQAEDVFGTRVPQILLYKMFE